MTNGLPAANHPAQRRFGLVARFALLMAAMAALPGCSANRMLDEMEGERAAIAGRTATVSRKSRDANTMGWNEARAHLLAHNLDIRRSNDRVADLERREREQWKEWLPRPTLYVNLQNSLRELGDLSGDKLSSALFAPLTIPNPVSQQARVYQNALQTVQARDAAEMGRRRQVIQLYRIFVDWRDMDAEVEAARGEESIEQAVEAALRRRESETREEERRDMMHAQLSNLLNMPGVNVVPLPGSLPKVDYSARLVHIVPGRNHGLLATRLAAYEIQGSLLRLRGSKLMKWPSVNVNSSVPSIYDSRRSDSPWLDNADQIFLFGAVTQSFDITGRQAADIRNAEENVGFVRESIEQRLHSDARQWQRLKARYGEVETKRRLLDARLAAIRKRGASGARAGDDLDDARTLLRESRNLERAKRQLDMEIWLWDDAAWK